IDLFHRSNPFVLPVRVIAASGTLYDPKVLRGQLIWTEVIFFHVRLPVSVVLGKVSATDHPTMVTTDAADNKGEAIVAIETPFERSRSAHKRPVLYRNRGEV